MEPMNVTNMMWRPPLLKLTSYSIPEINNGEPTSVFLEPSGITTIRRVLTSRKKPGVEESYPDIEVTEVFFCHGSILCMETPEQVAMLRDRAFGHEPPVLKSV